SATSRITSRGVYSNPVASDRFYTLNYGEPYRLLAVEGVEPVRVAPQTAVEAFRSWKYLHKPSERPRRAPPYDLHAYPHHVLPPRHTRPALHGPTRHRFRNSSPVHPNH